MTFLSLVFLLYAIYILWMRHALRNGNPELTPNKEEVVFISVVVPVRNETQHLASLFESLRQQKLGTNHFEIIWVNDHSDDDSSTQIHQFIEKESQLYQSLVDLEEGFGKKEAIKRGILQAQGNYILQIDADCTFSQQWLYSIFKELKRSPADLLILPVHIEQKPGFLPAFDSLDYDSLQAISWSMAESGYPIMCSGANLLYRVQLGEQFYEGEQKTSSGDDIFLLQFALSKQSSVRTFFTVNSVAHTQPASNWKAFIEQRQRWVSKNTGVKDHLYLFIMVLAWTVNMGILFSLYQDREHGLFLWGAKTVIEGLFFLRYYRNLEMRFPWFYYLISSAVYPFYIAYLTLTVIFTNSRWKGRNVVK